ncbi:MAG TPA: aminotransferase class V-fold PLP-dependent enzyme, partial [Gemmataceae bacterium]|nr:aminotransferase class V-fold PLP-dependent enzyme [Gemmataceae bacterium]
MSQDARAEKPIYLDFNATTPIDPAVTEAMLPWLSEHFGNPSSTHAYGQRTHDAVEKARGQVAALLGAQPDEIVFTSGG